MYEHQHGTVLVEVPPVGTALQVGADKLLALIEHERALATQASQGNLYDLRLYFEEYKRSSQTRHAADGMKLADSQRRYAELESRFIELQNAKWADDAAIQELSRRASLLEQERQTLCSELLKVKSCEDTSIIREDTSSTSTQDAFLARFGISPAEQKALCFGDKWLSLWNEIGRGIYHEMRACDALTPLDLSSLLQTATNQVRQDKQTIESLRDALTVLTKRAQFGPIHGETCIKPTECPTPLQDDSIALENNGTERKEYRMEPQAKFEPIDSYLDANPQPAAPTLNYMTTAS